jgi:hypothetical protein
MMKNEFIPYEEALAMKELGFDEELCFGFYSLHEDNKAVGGNYPCDGTNNAPLYQQAFRWFREKHGLDGHVRRGTKTMHEHLKKNGFTVADYEWVVMKTDGTSTHTRGMENTHTEGEQTCLKRLIEMVKENKDE